VLSERTELEQALDGMKDGLARARSRRDSCGRFRNLVRLYGRRSRVLAASSRDEALALVAEILEIPAEHERAVAAVLGEHLQAVIMRDHGAARDAVQALRRAGAGRVTCLPCEGSHGGPPRRRQRRRGPCWIWCGCAPGTRGSRALCSVTCSCGRSRCGARTLGNGEAGWTLVTPAGETLAASGAIAGGSERSEETLLAQRRELRALDGEVERR